MVAMNAPSNVVALPAPTKTVFTTRKQEFDHKKEQFRQERETYLEEWREISDYIQLRRGRYLITENRKNARRRSPKVFNERATFASRICGAGMFAGVSSPSRPWLKLKTPDAELNNFTGVKRWLDELNKIVYMVFSQSNFYDSKQSVYRDMADFGQGPMVIDEDFEDVISCYCSPPGEYMMSVNKRGIVDTLYREIQKTTLQVMTEFYQVGHIPREIRDAYDNGHYQRPWDITCVLEPNHARVKDAPGALGMPYVSVYYANGVSDTKENSAIISITGRHDNSVSAPRWDVQPGDVYGDGNGALMLPSVKSLQILEKTKGKLVDKIGDPVMQGPEVTNPSKLFNHRPGAMNYYPPVAAGAGAPIRPAYEIRGEQLMAVIEEMRTLEDRIDTGYYVPLFQWVIQSDRRQVTAREIDEGHEEKLVQLGPVLERTHHQGLNVEVKRTLGIAARAGILPPPPREVDGLPLQVEYVSILAAAQKALSARPIERFAGMMGNLAAGDPGILDKWDTDQTADEYSDALGVPASIVRSDEETAKLRKARSDQQAAEKNMMLASEGAKAAQVLSQADTGRNSNLLADILSGGGRLT